MNLKEEQPMTQQEKILSLTKMFGEPIAELPKDWEGETLWDGPHCLVFWADARNWNSLMLNQVNVPFRFSGPHSGDEAFLPFPKPGIAGYFILVEIE